MHFLTYETEFVLFLAVLDNCLAHGLRQLTHDVCRVRTLNIRSDVTLQHRENHHMTFGKGRYAT